MITNKRFQILLPILASLIAIAFLSRGRWHPIGITLACLLFGATEALQLRIQALGAKIPYQFLAMLPYAIAGISQ